MRAMLRLSPAILVAAVLGSTCGLESHAQDFRMESWVYRGKEKEPVSESLTLFKGGMVYDFALPELNEITVFDPSHARFVLLDCKRQVKTVLTTVEILEWVEDLKLRQGSTKDYLFEPKFEESYDAESRWIAMTGKDDNPISYRAKLLDPRPADAAYVKEYRRFADWYSRLNAAYKGNLHTLARIPLNKAIAERGGVPEEVELTISGWGGKAVRSRHLFNWKLSATDLKRIEKAGDGLSEYENVSLSKFRPNTKVAASQGK